MFALLNTSLLLMVLIPYWFWVSESICASIDESIYQDLLSGNRTLVAVGKVKDRVVIVIQPKNGNIPLNDTYVFETKVSNNNYTEIVLQNGELIGKHWPNFPALTQPLLTTFFLRDQGNNYFLIVCQKQDPPDFIDCQGYQVEGTNGASLHQVIHMPKLKMNYSNPTLMTDTGQNLHSYNLYNAGPDNVHLYPYLFTVDNSAQLIDESINWTYGDADFVLCEMNPPWTQIRMVDSYWVDCTQLGWVLYYAFFDEQHVTYFANGTIFRMDRFYDDQIDNKYVNVQKFTWAQYFRLTSSVSSNTDVDSSESNRDQHKRGLSVGVIVAITVIVVTCLAMLALGLVIFYLMGSNSSSTKSSKAQKSGRKSGANKKAANVPQKSNKNKSKATSKK